MTIAPKSIALAAAVMAQSIFVGANAASALPISFPDVSFPGAETREGCYFSGNCENAQTVTKQQNGAISGSAAPSASPRVSTKGDR